MKFLTRIIKAINTKSDGADLINEETKKEYIPFVVNKIFSNFPDTLFYAQEMNKFYNLDSELQYKYYWYVVNKRSRFAPIIKQRTEDEVEYAKLIAEIYGISTKKVLKNYLSLMEKEK